MTSGEVVELKPRSGKAVVRWDHDRRPWTMHGASLIPVPAPTFESAR